MTIAKTVLLLLKTGNLLSGARIANMGNTKNGITGSALTRLFIVMDMVFTNRIGSVVTVIARKVGEVNDKDRD